MSKVKNRWKLVSVVLAFLALSGWTAFGAYEWRGVHLDESRHFFGKQAVMKVLDRMAELGFNVFHWHLTDDHGWRVEIKSFPELTHKGAVRQRNTDPSIRQYWHDEGTGAYGPYFYTHDDIREIVAYAGSKGIRVVPEIEMPGHSLAALVAYPELCCFPDLLKGHDVFLHPNEWSQRHDARTYCLGSDESFRFLERVLDEICELFPDEVVHIGGDEINLGNWKDCPKCQSRIKAERLGDESGLQSWFVHRMVSYLARKGKKTMGWDEIATTNPDTQHVIVQCWHNGTKARQLVERGYEVVMSPTRYCYFDFSPGVPDDVYPYCGTGTTTVQRVSCFDPMCGIPLQFRSRVLGAECCNWTESTVSLDALEHKLWPRAEALSEVLKENGSLFIPFWDMPTRVVAYRLQDRTDGHDELVHKDEWLVGYSEQSVDLVAPIVAIENPTTGEGCVCVRMAPLPHAREKPEEIDFTFAGRAGQSGRRRGLRVHKTGYPCVSLSYAGGAVGRTKTLQDWQRTVRPYVPGRDGLFLSNTWGDRNRDTRINEAFLLEEVRAAAELGVDVVQIDDGWQSGRSMNSASKNGDGAWNGYWAVSPDFWVPDPKRFPRGLKVVTAEAASKGIRAGLWFGPDSTHDAANWERDADWLLKLHNECGVDYFKLDSMKTSGRIAQSRQQKLFDKVLSESKGKVVIDMDVTAEKRPGYFGMMTAGPLFVENRYTDWKTYWPHLTLRSLWSLSEVIDPIRLRMEVLNPLRNVDKYAGSPLAPSAYPAEALFAIVMASSPLGWFEIQNLAPETMAVWKPLVAAWKRERDAMAACNVLPVGARPDGVSWTGFVFTPRLKGKPAYGLFFRELAKESHFGFDIRAYLPNATKVTVLSPRGKADLSGVEAPVRDFVWARIE